jgi:hypothetical protein
MFIELENHADEGVQPLHLQLERVSAGEFGPA